MISYAYRTPGRDEENIVLATECTEADQGVPMYCPNFDCNAQLFLCNLKNPDIKPYFRATLKAHPHIEGCRYSKLNYKMEDYNELEFDFDLITKNVMKPSRTEPKKDDSTETSPKTGSPSPSTQRKLPPHTIKQVFELAISHSIDFTYNGIKMWQILADRRSSHIYNKGIFRNCLVEAVFAGFNAEKKFIRMKYFTGTAAFHYLKLSFYNDNVFNSAVKILLETKPAPAIVWGEWKQVDYCFKATIHSLNQIYVP